MTKVRWAVAALFALPSIAAGYMAWLLWRANDEGRWMFMVFAAFFLVLSASPFLPSGTRQKKNEGAAATRFAPAWVLPFYLLLFGGLLILATVIGLFHHRGR
jgi:hypothetical protein